ncbi:hypothetical protein BGZ49_006929 [Haplosporangium sp. Z 27]|nr:hypothetical protein BGZ49_006929 [Haplosporangium sp. Z 27]
MSLKSELSTPDPPPPPSPKPHALDLVEISTLIALELSKRDLANCICVSKNWSFKFLPHYWHSVFVPPNKTALSSSQSTISKYGSLVRFLAAGIIGETSVFNQPSLSHLQQLEVSTSGSRTSQDHGRGCLSQIVERNQESLKEICWRCYGHDTFVGRPYRIWIGLFRGLDCLVTVKLSNWSMNKEDFMGMLRACPTLRDLTLEATEEIRHVRADEMNTSAATFFTDNIGTPDLESTLGINLSSETLDSDSDHDDIKSSKNPRVPKKLAPPPEFVHNSLESLHFIGNLIPSFLLYVPNIKCLRLTKLLNGDFQDLEHQIQTTQCLANVTHLYTLTKCQYPPQYMALVNGLPSPNYLVHFEGHIPARIARQFLEIIMEQHANSIEHLVIPNGEQEQEQEYSPLGFEFNIWRILESCSRLTRLEIPYFLGYASVYVTSTLKPVLNNDGTESSVESVDIVRKVYEPNKEWVCKDLKRLYLRIRDMDRMHTMDQITFDLCVYRLIPPEDRQERIHNGTHRRTLTTTSALEKMILEKLSGLPKLDHLNIGSGWCTYSTSPSKILT